MTGDHLLSVVDLKKHFRKGVSWRQSREGDIVRAVDGVNLHILAGETLGLVGETGSGKTTLARCILRTCDVTSGSVVFEGLDITNLGRRQLLQTRRDMQIVFQDSHGALNPRRRVGQIIGEPMSVHGVAKGDELKHRVHELMEVVGLNPNDYNRFPGEFSGGQRQRIGLARAVGLRPKLIVLDEPVSALDSSIQAQILNLMIDLKNEFKLAYLLISHDLSVVNHLSDRVAVMYAGKIVEMAPTSSLMSDPRHHYSYSLQSSVRVMKNANAMAEAESPPTNGDVDSGCAFRPRCPASRDLCKSSEPPLIAVNTEGDHEAACYFPRRGLSPKT
ncbi:MAG TPA: ABC transporter ATP-binding protein [Acidimicrobiales bacterium]|nr:ABC transporter ATP-binding protein [Acidimicrobiales bacterium]